MEKTIMTQMRSNLSKAGAALVVLALTAACGNVSPEKSQSATPKTPTPAVLSNAPLNGATGVARDTSLSVTFSEAMDVATLNETTFTLTSGKSAVTGTVSYANSTAVFLPAAPLADSAALTATITVGAKSAKGIALGAAHSWSFTAAKAVPTLSALTLSVASGTDGDPVSVTGTGFGAAQGASTLTLGGQPITPIAWTETKIDFTVPLYVPAGLSAISLSVGEETSTADFTVQTTISSLSQSSGTASTLVIVTGTNFGQTKGTSTISLAGVALTPIAWTYTEIQFLVPGNAPAGVDSIDLNVGGQTASMPFTVTIPALTFSVNGGMGGDVITITGAGFGSTPGTLTLNGVAVTASVWSDTAIDFAVPAGVTAGTYTLLIGVGGQTATEVFYVYTSILNATPASGSATTVVTVSGSNYGDAQGTNTISLYGMAITPSSWTNTAIQFAIPGNIPAGVRSIDLNIGGQTATWNITVTLPVLTLSANNGASGDAITITGSNFGSTPATLTLGGLAVTASSWTDTAISFSVPSNIAAGSHTLSVTVGGQTATANFTKLAGPTIDLVTPLNGATDVPRIASISATFNVAMDGATINGTTFTLTSGDPAVVVPGTVSYANLKAVFLPAASLATNSTFTATISTGVKSASNVAMAADYIWSFNTTTNSTLPVDLGTAENFVIVAETFVSGTTTTSVKGDIATSPAYAIDITGFALTLDVSEFFSTSAQVLGKVYTADNSAPTPLTVSTAVQDMELAFADAEARTPDFIDVGDGAIGGMALSAGVYHWSGSVSMATDVTLNGSATDVWIFQIAQDVTLGTDAALILTGGASPANVFWQVGGQVEVGSMAHIEGMVLSQSAITLYTGASARGRLLSQTSVTLMGDSTVNAGGSGLGVNLGMAHDYVILAKTAISLVPDASKLVTGNIGVSPAAASVITGFVCVLDSVTGDFAIDVTYLIGKCYASDYVGTANGLKTTPDNLTTAVNDMGTAFVDAAGRAPDATELYNGDISGRTMVAGVYKWSSGLLIQSDIYLTGSATDVWIFQIAQNLTVGSNVTVHLAGGALPENIFWQVSSNVVLGTGSHFEGIVLAQTDINVQTGASVNGRLLSQTAVALDSNTVTQPND